MRLGSHFVFPQFLDHSEVAVASIVDNDVELAEVVGGSLHRVVVGAPVGDIELHRQDSVVVPLDERRKGLE